MIDRSDRRADGLARYGFLHDPAGRVLRGRRIVALLRAFFADDLSGMRVLDIGCSAGLITHEIARYAQRTLGIDVDHDAIAFASARHAIAGRLFFAIASGDAVPCADAAFDIVVCNHVYEHARNAQSLMAEIERVLRPGGACWFAAGHTWQIIEPHHRLPLLSLIPRSLASAVLRATGRDTAYNVRFLSPWRVPSLFERFVDVRLVSVDALRDPARFELLSGPLRFASIRALVRPFAPILAWLAPTQLWILRKRKPCAGRLPK
jgi:2-polyprenyl-3-methyl-5-hydroxy-6-metoxy-1,4-benzoquinol methylase